MYTENVEKALQSAAVLHKDQLRMGKVRLPYITHLMAVALIVKKHTADEVTFIAALLHDTLEDTTYTIKELRENFGEEVTDIVSTLTEPKNRNGERLSWSEKKSEYTSQLENGGQKALLIAAADKLHNFSTILKEYENDPQRYIRDFGQSSSERIAVYQKMADVINSQLKNDLVHEFNSVFNKFKEFLIYAEKSR